MFHDVLVGCWSDDNDGDAGDNSEVITAEVTGSRLCQSLIKCYDVVLLKPTQDQQQFFVMKAAVINALKALLAVSATAKTTALEGNL